MSTPPSPPSPSSQPSTAKWRQALQDVCAANGFRANYHIVSDRRGGRTAWSATVSVGNSRFDARFWYDGQYLDNAKEDAAEVALSNLKKQLSGNNSILFNK
ncbi:hypothetical protein BDZ91DRAFT_793367 [Kalaharituber pfeilii]|nr:hypothetical protein BDZ91DRAFT_793367 [Kalaharituber pfeilii]